MRDKLQGEILGEVVCLRSKIYSIDFVGGKKQSAKGVSKTVKQTLDRDLFKQCFLMKKNFTKILTQLRSFNYQLSSFDDKRYILDVEINSLASGHYRIP